MPSKLELSPSAVAFGFGYASDELSSTQALTADELGDEISIIMSLFDDDGNETEVTLSPKSIPQILATLWQTVFQSLTLLETAQAGMAWEMFVDQTMDIFNRNAEEWIEANTNDSMEAASGKSSLELVRQCLMATETDSVDAPVARAFGWQWSPFAIAQSSAALAAYMLTQLAEREGRRPIELLDRMMAKLTDD